MRPHPDDAFFPCQRPGCRWELQVLVQSSGATVQEAVAAPIVVSIGQVAVVLVAIVVDPIGDAFHGAWPCQ